MAPKKTFKKRVKKDVPNKVPTFSDELLRFYNSDLTSKKDCLAYARGKATLENWNEEFLDFTSYSLRTILLYLLHKQIRDLSVTDVMCLSYCCSHHFPDAPCLSYPLRRLFDVFLRKRRKFPWKTEVKAVIFSWICYYSVQVFVSKHLLEKPIIEASLWFMFLTLSMPLMKFFPLLPLPAFVDELLIQPLFASIVEYYPLYVAHPELSRIYYRVLGCVIGFVGVTYINALI